jgi:hypothetical protein
MKKLGTFDYLITKVSPIEMINYFIDLELIRSDDEQDVYKSPCPFCDKGTLFVVLLKPLGNDPDESASDGIFCKSCGFDNNFIEFIGRMYGGKDQKDRDHWVEDSHYFIRTRFRERFENETQEEKHHYEFKIESLRDHELVNSLLSHISDACKRNPKE